jgi:hypothetical protein
MAMTGEGGHVCPRKLCNKQRGDRTNFQLLKSSYFKNLWKYWRIEDKEHTVDF